MLRAELAAVVGLAIQKVAKQGTAVHSVVRLKDDNGVKAIRVEVVPLEGRRAQGRDYLVLFQEERAHGLAAAAAAGTHVESGDEGSGPAVVRLKQELASTRDHLQSLVSDHEVTSEELKTANEEALAANEELESTNEQLQTAKEELQSSNEEL